MSRATLLLALLLAGCHAHTGANLGPRGSNAAPGTGINLYPGPAVGTLIGLGFMAAIVRSDSDYAERAVPELDPTRRVQEQDCSKPIEDFSANLRCR